MASRLFPLCLCPWKQMMGALPLTISFTQALIGLGYSFPFISQYSVPCFFPVYELSPTYWLNCISCISMGWNSSRISGSTTFSTGTLISGLSPFLWAVR